MIHLIIRTDSVEGGGGLEMLAWCRNQDLSRGHRSLSCGFLHLACINWNWRAFLFPCQVSPPGWRYIAFIFPYLSGRGRPVSDP